mgnify:CR=1 FL=1
MSKITDAEANATSLDGLVNDNALVPTLRNGPKPSYQYLVDGWTSEFDALIDNFEAQGVNAITSINADVVTVEAAKNTAINNINADVSAVDNAKNSALDYIDGATVEVTAKVDSFNSVADTAISDFETDSEASISAFETNSQAVIIEMQKSRGFRVVGTFADGFTYELFNDVGIDTDGNSWIYVGAGAPNKVVAAGTVPSVSAGYEQVTFNSASGVLDSRGTNVQDYIDGNLTPFKTVADMKAAAFLSTLPEFTRVEWQGYYAQSDGGSNWGVLKFGAHTADGGSIFSIDSNTYVEANLKGNKVSVKKFGAMGGGVEIESSQITNACAYCKTGGTLDFGDGEYELGEISVGEKWKIFIDSPNGLTMLGNKAIFKATTTKTKDSIFSIKNPNNVKVRGLYFTNPGFNIADTIGGGDLRVGTYGLYFWADSQYSASNPCGVIDVEGGAFDTIGFVTITAEPTVMGGSDVTAESITNVRVRGDVERVYYGVTSIYQAKNLDVKLNCVNVRRGLIVYGQKKASVEINLHCTENFLGSNAFVSLTCEGDVVTINGVGYDGNIDDIDVRVRVSGVESHEGLVTFYHQGDNPNGQINNVKSRVTCDNLTTEGATIYYNPLYVYKFFHTLSTGVNLSPTTREINGMNIDCEVSGSIAGGSWQVNSVPDTQRVATVGVGVFENAPLSGSNGLWQFFKILKGRQSSLFTPTVFGSSLAGSATYTVNNGLANVIDGVCHFSATMEWTDHNGEGTVRIAGLPFLSRDTSIDGTPPITVNASGWGSLNFNYPMTARVTGNRTTVTPYVIISGSLGIPAIPAQGSISISGSYPLY